MVMRIRASEPSGLNKGSGLKFLVGSRTQQETPQEGWRIHQSEHCEYNNKNENNNPKTLNDKKRFYKCHFLISHLYKNAKMFIE